MDLTQRLAQLAVEVGANVQPGQVVAVSAELGHAEVVRAVAEAAYRRGARFVDVRYFDPHVQRERIQHAPLDELAHIPDWEAQRVRRLGEEGGASIKITGPTAPGLFDDLDPVRVGRVSLPWVPQFRAVELLVNWTVVPAPSAAWARKLRPELLEEDALAALWEDIAFVCRLDEPDPATSWRARLGELHDRARMLNGLDLDAVHLRGPDTDLCVGLLAGARWEQPLMVTGRGVEHLPNLPTEEMFTVPDPRRVDGHVRLTRPALVGGRLIENVRLTFSGGRVVGVEGGSGVEALREFVNQDPGAARLGELALVDGSGRVGALERTFGVILLDENAASHIALGFGFPELVEPDQRAEVNESEHHLDVMIGSDQLKVSGVDRNGAERPLLHGGEWATG